MNTFDYTLNVQTTARTANGSVQVKVTETDAAGNVTASCDSGAVSFTTGPAEGSSELDGVRVGLDFQ